MGDTSTSQANSTNIQSSASGSSKPAAAAAAAELSRGELLKKVLIQHSFGLLCLRLALGGTMIAYGVPKFMGGSEYLRQVGSAVQYIGIGFGFEFFGLLAALTEVVGGMMLIFGAYYRISCVTLAFVMFMATLTQKAGLPANYTPTDFIMAVLHPLSMGAIFISAMFLGPGRLSIQKE
jgi:putative oxidoreductase